ncbi:MAG: hypothetical protein ABIU58_07455 [Ramlibacter sp.]
MKSHWVRDMLMNAASSLPVMGPMTRQVLVGVRQGWWPGQTLQLAQESLAEPSPQPGTAG